MNDHPELLYESLRFAVKYFRNTLRLESTMRTEEEEEKSRTQKAKCKMQK